MNGQIASVHILRGLAALLVVWAHLSSYWLFSVGETSALQDAWSNVVAEPLHVYQDGGFLGVLIFFLISGYIVTHASLSETRSSFAIKRALRIFPALLFALAVLWVLMHLMPAFGVPLLTFNGGSAGRWLQTFLLLDGYTTGPHILSVTWTLAVEMLFYALVFVAIGKQRAYPLASTVAMVVAWAIACLAAFQIEAWDGRNPEILARGIVILLGVLLVGRCIYLAHARMAPPAATIGLGVVTSIGVGAFQERHSPGFLLTPGGVADAEPVIAYAVAVTVFIAMLAWAPKRAVQPFAFLGDISYSLYLLHMPVGFATLGVLQKLDVPNSAATIIAIAVAMGVSWVSFRLVEKPGQRLARTLLSRKTRSLEVSVN